MASRHSSGYHNKEWADKMESVGLIPSSTGFPGGNKTGQAMSDYPEENGVFMAALEAMPASFKLPFVSTEGDMLAMMLSQGNGSPSTGASGRPEGGYVPLSAGSRKNKTKYRCSCGTNVWGKPDLQIICGECGEAFQETA